MALRKHNKHKEDANKLTHSRPRDLCLPGNTGRNKEERQMEIKNILSCTCVRQLARRPENTYRKIPDTRLYRGEADTHRCIYINNSKQISTYII